MEKVAIIVIILVRSLARDVGKGTVKKLKSCSSYNCDGNGGWWRYNSDGKDGDDEDDDDGGKDSKKGGGLFGWF